MGLAGALNWRFVLSQVAAVQVGQVQMYSQPSIGELLCALRGPTYRDSSLHGTSHGTTEAAISWGREGLCRPEQLPA